MAGSIRPRPDRGPNIWQLRVYLGRDGNGRVRHKSRYFEGSRRAAERKLARLVTLQELEPAVVPDDASSPWGPATTVNDALAGWKANGWDDLSPATVRRYEDIWRLYIRDGIGKRKIASLGPYDVEQYFRHLKAKGASRETVRYVRSLLHRSCRLARKWSGNQLHNPVADTELPSWGVDSAPEPVRAPTIDEVAKLLSAAQMLELRYMVALRVVAATGMRRGEVAALRWSDVDWDAATVTVNKSIAAASGGAILKSPKSRASVRQVALDQGTLEALGRLRAQQLSLASVVGIDLSDDGFVFSAEPDAVNPPYPDTLSRAFLQARKAAQLPSDLHLHSLRHFQATLLEMSDVASDASFDTRRDDRPPGATCPLCGAVLPTIA